MVDGAAFGVLRYPRITSSNSTSCTSTYSRENESLQRQKIIYNYENRLRKCREEILKDDIYVSPKKKDLTTNTTNKSETSSISSTGICHLSIFRFFCQTVAVGRSEEKNYSSSSVDNSNDGNGNVMARTSNRLSKGFREARKTSRRND